MTHYPIDFPGTDFKHVDVPAGELLSLHLDATNSPLLFGCRAGLCGTCLIDVLSGEEGTLPPPSPEEREALEVYAPDQPNARLACQVRATAAMSVIKLA